MLNAHCQVPWVNNSRMICYDMLVKMPVNVSLEPLKLLGMNWYMTQDALLKYVVCPNIPKEWRVGTQIKDVMVALDQHLVAVQPIKNKAGFLVDEHISKMVHFIVWTNHAVPVLDKHMIHLCNVIPRT